MTAGDDGCLDLTDIQGIAFYAYSHHAFARYLLVTFGPDRAARAAWLARLVEQVRSADEARHAHVRHDQPWHLQVAITYRGLEALGLSATELDGFPREFVMGMNHDERTRKLGDPPQKHWQFGAKQHDPVHALIMLFGRTQADLDTLYASQLDALTAAGATVAHDDRATLQPGSREHLGFHDGVSQPHIAGGPRSHRDPDPSLPAGELMLGQRDAYGQTAPSPLVRGFDLGSNGSYLVYRKLEQHVFTFWQTLRTHARPLPGENQTDAASGLARPWWAAGPEARRSSCAPPAIDRMIRRRTTSATRRPIRSGTAAHRLARAARQPARHAPLVGRGLAGRGQNAPDSSGGAGRTESRSAAGAPGRPSRTTGPGGGSSSSACVAACGGSSSSSSRRGSTTRRSPGSPARPIP